MDLVSGLSNWRLSHLLGLGEIRRRYARSRLGQFWLTLSTGIMVTTMGFVWSWLWHVPLADIMPFITVSLIVWNMVTGILGEATGTFVTTGPIFLNQGMSFSTAIYGLIYKQILMFLHNLPIIALVMLVFRVPVGWSALWSLIGLALTLITLVWSSYVVAIICLRFRDLTQVVQSVLMIAFFVTPVLWKPDQLPPERQWLLAINPLSSLLSTIRKPLFGGFSTQLEWTVAIGVAFGGLIIALPIIGFCRRRLVYWI